MPVPYTFGTATAAIPLSQLDSNFATAITLGNTAVYLGNTTTSLGNVTLTNVTISSGNVTVSNITANAVTSPAATNLLLQSAGTTAVNIDTSQNVGVGVTPSAFGGGYKGFEIGAVGNALTSASTVINLSTNAIRGSSWTYGATGRAVLYQQDTGAGTHAWFNAPSGTAGNTITFTQAMTLDASSNLLVGTTSVANSSRQTIGFVGSTSNGLSINDTEGTTVSVGYANFSRSGTSKGSITYSNTTGLVAYNTTSDYRAKDISGPLSDSGALIDSVPVYMGKMKGATQERPMFIAHETPAYAHTGEKDAVDADGNPVYQQMDASALIPVMWAEIQSLRKRLITLEAK